MMNENSLLIIEIIKLFKSNSPLISTKDGELTSTTDDYSLEFYYKGVFVKIDTWGEALFINSNFCGYIDRTLLKEIKTFKNKRFTGFDKIISTKDLLVDIKKELRNKKIEDILDE